MYCNVLIDAYMTNNFGDDLFVLQICKMFPNIQFHVISSYKINPTPTNLHIHKTPLLFLGLNKAIRVCLKKEINIYRLLAFKSKKYVHIIRLIGSGYIQRTPDYMPNNRKMEEAFYNSRSSVIGCNFGPYFSKEYLEHFRVLFGKLSGISFRDEYSYHLFKDTANCIYAPDMLFGLDISMFKQPKKNNTVLISVMDLKYGNYTGRAEYNEDYYLKMKQLIQMLIGNGYTVTLVGLCEYEGDKNAIMKLKEDIALPSLQVLSYPSDSIEKLMNAFAESEYLVSTRFHSLVLGLLFKCKLMPISYNIKVANMLATIRYNKKIVKLEELSSLEDSDLYYTLIKGDVFELDHEIVEKAQKHYWFLSECMKLQSAISDKIH